ncbi:ABC-type transport auxiliary lipoprotein family protein [Paracoccus sp. MBLB3053]|uniref:ABC-type transport auxiliary lipoprotein family protein n=1 Tax=Paracoccus aurantius TaxID=3073814 RepID=A0ABU2HR31_9RHOB|nr:ABC-type transport auxiliary lipoprotein family protein [Paracoccus sp. MBLB3053]MDS9467000.1 ABC-type transport auxiliary lipoprotein family protein [Paracoccus sp. MBLB3053]
MTRLLSATILALTTALPGCAAITNLSGGPSLEVFEIRPLAGGPKTCGRGRTTELVIEEPKARGTLNTERIMIRPSTLQTQYLPDAQWGDTVPITLQNLLVRGFGSYDVFTHVGRAPLGLGGDYALISEINDFNAEVSGKGAIIRLSVDAQLVRESDASVIARGKFSTTATSPTTRTSDLIPAFDAAGQQLLVQITDWGLQGIGVNPATCR